MATTVEHRLKADAECPRILHIERTRLAGLGHQISEMLVALRLSSQLNLTPHLTKFDFVESNHGENYSVINDLFGLHAISNKSGVMFSLLEQVTLGSLKPADCGVLVVGDMSTCRTINCFHSPSTSLLFNDAPKWFRQVAVDEGNWLHRDPFLSTDTFNVVWHVRVGDVHLHRPGDSFYENILTELEELFNDFKHVVHFFLGAWHRLSDREYEEYELFFKNLTSNASLVWSNTEDSLLSMMHADMLIGSGSSLPLVAKLFSEKPIYVNTESKKPGHDGWGFLGDYFMNGITSDCTGRIYQHLSEMRALFHTKHIRAKLKVSTLSTYFNVDTHNMSDFR